MSLINRCKNPFDEVAKVAQAQKVDPKTLDFRLVRFTTTLTQGDDIRHIKDYEGLDCLLNNDYFCQEDLVITQSYRIEIIPARPSLLNLDVRLSANTSLTRLIVGIKANAAVVIYDGLGQDIYKEILRQLLKAKVLVGVRFKDTQTYIKKLVAHIKSYGMLSANYSFDLAYGVEPIPFIGRQIIHRYKEEHEEEQQDKVDYSQRGYLKAVQTGDVVLEVIPPSPGMPGRNLRGELIPAPHKAGDEEEIKFGPNIEKREDESGRIEYLAKCSGYVSCNSGVYDIGDNLEVSVADFKTTGSIEGGIDKNIKLSIAESSILKDAVGANLLIEIEEISVKGSVAQGAVIKAQRAEIGGQTHGKSRVEAHDLKIAVHRGFASGNVVEIGRLEGGEVQGHIVFIDQVMGGKVRAERLYVNKIYSNSQIHVSELVVLNNCLGQNNKFSIDPSTSAALKEELLQKQKHLESIKKELYALSRGIETKRKVIEVNKSAVASIRGKIAELKASRMPIPEAFYQKLSDFGRIIAEYNDTARLVSRLNAEVKESKLDIEKAQERVFDSHVINLGKWQPLNEIKFILLAPEMELVYEPELGEVAKDFMIKPTEDEDGNRTWRIVVHNSLSFLAKDEHYAKYKDMFKIKEQE